MNALALLNNFEREFARPFFSRDSWLNDLQEIRPQNGFSSAMSYDEKKAAWTLTLELAGVTKENLKIDTLDAFIQLSGEKTKGLNQGKFEGRYHLPEGIDAEKIEAAFEDGVLTVTMPMAEKKATKTIQIR